MEQVWPLTLGPVDNRADSIDDPMIKPSIIAAAVISLSARAHSARNYNDRTPFDLTPGLTT